MEPAERTARERLLAWWADRLLDPEFERRCDELLAGAPASARAELKALVETYRLSALDEKAVRMMDEYDAAERLERLMKVDLQGRRRKVESVLARILGELQAGDPAHSTSWTGLMGFLRHQAAADSEAEGDALAAEGRVSSELSLVYWNAAAAPPALDKPVKRLLQLDARASAARRSAQAAWLARAQSPADHLLKDKALEEYVAALEEFDAELARTLELPEAAADAAWTRALDGLFGVRASLARRADRLRWGRGILTLDAAIALGESRLRALRFDPAEARELAPASESLAFLRAMKARWTGRTEPLPALVALRSKDGIVWSGAAEIRRLEAEGRLVVVAGRRFSAPRTFVGAPPADGEAALAAGWSEIIEGDDAARERLALVKSRRDEAARRAALDRALETAEVVLDGRGAGEAISLSDLRRLEREGRVLWFEAALDSRTGLRRAVPRRRRACARRRSSSPSSGRTAPARGRALALARGARVLRRRRLLPPRRARPRGPARALRRGAPRRPRRAPRRLAQAQAVGLRFRARRRRLPRRRLPRREGAGQGDGGGQGRRGSVARVDVPSLRPARDRARAGRDRRRGPRGNAPDRSRRHAGPLARRGPARGLDRRSGSSPARL
ncbi:MAG: hypothetical protein M0D55_11815 [Elusimicrobiota bacterium]|nr:MAG: hypothetical protein M0D55_11815 [Elusimicrobiota bacterium]